MKIRANAEGEFIVRKEACRAFSHDGRTWFAQILSDNSGWVAYGALPFASPAAALRAANKAFTVGAGLPRSERRKLKKDVIGKKLMLSYDEEQMLLRLFKRPGVMLLGKGLLCDVACSLDDKGLIRHVRSIGMIGVEMTHVEFNLTVQGSFIAKQLARGKTFQRAPRRKK
jgi:hypothetical protein